MTIVTPQAVQFTVAQFDRMADCGVLSDNSHRIELLGGFLHEMPPIGTAHVIIVQNLTSIFLPLIAQGRFYSQQPLIVSEFDEPLPDVCIVRERIPDRKPNAGDCQLVIEVSDSSYRDDVRDKLPAYLRAGLKVWIVNVAMRQIEVYRDGRLIPDRVARGDDFVDPAAESDLPIVIARVIFEGLP